MRVLRNVFALFALALIFVVEAVPVDNDNNVLAKRGDAQLIPRRTTKAGGTTARTTATAKSTSVTKTAGTLAKASSASKLDSASSKGSVSSSSKSSASSSAKASSSSGSLKSASSSSSMKSSVSVLSSMSSSSRPSSSGISSAPSASSIASGASSSGGSSVASSSASSMGSLPSATSCPPKRKRFTTLNVRATQFQAVYMTDGRTYTFTATNRLSSGEHGVVYDVQENCNWVAKQLTQDSEGSEVNNLNAIGELIAYSGSGSKNGDWIVMAKQTGVQLQRTAEYRAATNQDERAAVVDKAYGYVYARAQQYVTQKGVLNLDLDQLNNVLFVEQNGQIVGANIVDWDYTTTGATQEDLDEDAENWRSNWYHDYVYTTAS